MWVFDVNEMKRAGMGNAQGHILIVLHKADAADSKWGKAELEDGDSFACQVFATKKNTLFLCQVDHAEDIAPVALIENSPA